MLMTKSRHEAIVAQKDAEIAGLQQRINRLFATQKGDSDRIRQLKDRGTELWQRAHDAEAKLAVFTAPRQRDAKGHFVSAKGAGK